ncbi:Chromosome transmission fidelity protein 18-like protein [Smittium mucronatum]|uniref:Chromosome transmission fidelity protein 18-like protein n=1 Tax=Smittium mucronatum TaxID=133383 RepID=A0A1R0H579_9FUNG|nr:Chromosome transmission fidelity protein 18-like protein [Smittium mucronatum]
MVVQVSPPSSHQVSRYLSLICEKEGVNIDSWGLTSIANNTECDLRSCINILQYWNFSNSENKNSGFVNSGVNYKDTHTPLFTAWESIFTEPNSKNYKQYMQKFDRSTYREKFTTNLVNLLRKVDDYDKLMQGVFENYLKMETKDLTYKVISNLSSDWFSFYDKVDLYIKSNPSNGFILWDYLPQTFVAVNKACGRPLGLTGVDFTWPKTDQQENELKKKFMSTAAIFLDGIGGGGTRNMWDMKSFSFFIYRGNEDEFEQTSGGYV